MDRELRTQARLSKRTLTTQADIGNTVYGTEVHSVNGKAGHVVLNAEDVGALPSDTPIPSLDGYATEEWVQEQGYATLADIPTDVSAFSNDAGYLTQHQDLSDYAPKSTVYTKAQVDTALQAKADASDVLTPLIGDADDITPQQVMECLEEGRNVSVSKEFEFSGVNFNLTFTAWNRVTDVPYEGQYVDLVISNTIVVFGEGYYLFEMLGGKYNNGTMPWQIVSTQITTPQDLSDYATKSEIPTVTNDFTNAYKNKVDSLWEDYQSAITALG